jgi:hypothetical protein
MIGRMASAGSAVGHSGGGPESVCAVYGGLCRWPRRRKNRTRSRVTRAVDVTASGTILPVPSGVVPMPISDPTRDIWRRRPMSVDLKMVRAAHSPFDREYAPFAGSTLERMTAAISKSAFLSHSTPWCAAGCSHGASARQLRSQRGKLADKPFAVASTMPQCHRAGARRRAKVWLLGPACRSTPPLGPRVGPPTAHGVR